ncbi:MAG: glycosyl transferase group 1, partial [Akkermansiaceae bacterium]|nr:glycosyl transferase group 1 [Akkermansiaceae bacterium]
MVETFQSILSSIGAPIPGRPRVLIFADSPLPSLLHGALGRGGGQGATWLSQVAQGYAAATDLEIVWIDFAVGSKESEIHRLENQTFIRLAHPKHSWDLLLKFRIVRWRARRLLKKLQPAVVHCWGTERIHSAVLAVATCPTILSMQGILTRYHEIGGLPSIWQWQVMVNSEPQFIRAATVVTSESKWGLDQVLRIHPAAVTEQVEYGVHPSFYDVAWQPDPQRPLIFYSGSIDWRKGLDVLLAAAALPGERHWTLAIAG